MLSASRAEERWYPKALRAADRDLESTARGRAIRYIAEFRKSELEVRLAPDLNDAKVFEIWFDVRGWESLRDAIPKARAQLLAGLRALAEPLGLTEELDRDEAARVLPPRTPTPRAQAHPRARELLKEDLFWDPCDEYGIGDDTGADVVGVYAEWRAGHSAEGREGFFDGLLRSWNCPGHDEDDAAIAFAVAQLMFDGHLSGTSRDRALAALERQKSDAVIRDRGWDSAGRRRKALDVVQAAIERAPRG